MSHPVPPPLPTVHPAPDSAPLSVEQLKRDVLPALFLGRIDIGRYGPADLASASAEPAWQEGSAHALARALADLVSRLSEHDPNALLERASWWDRFTGADIERQLRRRIAMGGNGDVLSEVEHQAAAVRSSVDRLNAQLDAHDEQGARLQIYIDAGVQFLQELPADSGTSDDPLVLDRPVERLQRRVANLTALLASHSMSRIQVQLARNHAIELLDRYCETVQILLPIWRQTIQALQNSDNASPQMVARAAQAQDQLKQALQQLLRTSGAPA
ncbi:MULTISPECIES: protein klaA [Stenotrophomonas]|uniref:protein klaA n=1 Tax=Stenotrophomonas TaxID=40323 RepID=UPI000D53E5A3|nr:MULTISPECIES: protein klaA [Stenotrophomonas]AWH23345.1 protein klaA [Stenotrophomonas sp. ZAC14D2_NAIMI4_6]